MSFRVCPLLEEVFQTLIIASPQDLDPVFFSLFVPFMHGSIFPLASKIMCTPKLQNLYPCPNFSSKLSQKPGLFLTLCYLLVFHHMHILLSFHIHILMYIAHHLSLSVCRSLPLAHPFRSPVHTCTHTTHTPYIL